VIDRERILAKLDELEGYLGELRSIAPDRFEEYRRINDEIVFDTVRQRLGDFDVFKREILSYLRKPIP
jgi:uncharacterized protein YutE (UPF0331/DUF86 family)